MGQPVVHFEILGKDGKKLQSFYSRLFGWKINAENPMSYGLVDTQSNGKGIGGGIAQAPPNSPYRVTVFVEVEDLDACLKKIATLGGKTVMPPTVIPKMVAFALFSDPEGNVVGIVKSEVPQ